MSKSKPRKSNPKQPESSRAQQTVRNQKKREKPKVRAALQPDPKPLAAYLLGRSLCSLPSTTSKARRDGVDGWVYDVRHEIAILTTLILMLESVLGNGAFHELIDSVHELKQQAGLPVKPKVKVTMLTESFGLFTYLLKGALANHPELGVLVEIGEILGALQSKVEHGSWHWSGVFPSLSALFRLVRQMPEQYHSGASSFAKIAQSPFLDEIGAYNSKSEIGKCLQSLLPNSHSDDPVFLLQELHEWMEADLRKSTRTIFRQEDPNRCWHSDDYGLVIWFGKSFQFTPTQRRVVAKLWHAWEKGLPGCTSNELLKLSKARSDKLRAIFRSPAYEKHIHPAWGTMICKGELKHTWCLKPLARK